MNGGGTKIRKQTATKEKQRRQEGDICLLPRETEVLKVNEGRKKEAYGWFKKQNSGNIGPTVGKNNFIVIFTVSETT